MNTDILLPLMVFIACLCPDEDFDSKKYRGKFYKEENIKVGICISILQQHWDGILPDGVWGRYTITAEMLKRAVNTHKKKVEFNNTFNVSLEIFLAHMEKKEQRGFSCILIRIFKVLNLPYKKDHKRGDYQMDMQRFNDYLKLCVFWKTEFRQTIHSAAVEMPDV